MEFGAEDTNSILAWQGYQLCHCEQVTSFL